MNCARRPSWTRISAWGRSPKCQFKAQKGGGRVIETPPLKPSVQCRLCRLDDQSRFQPCCVRSLPGWTSVCAAFTMCQELLPSRHTFELLSPASQCCGAVTIAAALLRPRDAKEGAHGHRQLAAGIWTWAERGISAG